MLSKDLRQECVDVLVVCMNHLRLHNCDYHHVHPIDIEVAIEELVNRLTEDNNGNHRIPSGNL